MPFSNQTLKKPNRVRALGEVLVILLSVSQFEPNHFPNVKLGVIASVVVWDNMLNGKKYQHHILCSSGWYCIVLGLRFLLEVIWP